MDNTLVRRASVCFIRDGEKVLLALIEDPSNHFYWNGLGGWVEIGESIEDGVIREIKEETYIDINKHDLKKVVQFTGGIHLNVFIADSWSGEVKAKETSLKELKWFSKENIPYSEMIPGTEKWLPIVLDGKLLLDNGNGLHEVENLE